MKSAKCTLCHSAPALHVANQPVIMHSTLLTHNSATVRLFASARSWIEGEAVRQLYATAKLDGVCQAVGLPDLHPGKGSPVGAAFVTEGIIYPHVIGGDIGCGMAVEADSFAAGEYLRGHDFAVRWAKASRELIAKRFVAALGAEAACLWDGCHNSIPRHEVGWIHRKGAVAADGDFVVIPGSRGSLSYIVRPVGDGESHAWSLAHGAGRKWARSDARQRMRERFGMQQLLQTPLGSRVVCEERDLLYEEAPAAYKNIEAVIADLVAAGLVSVIATLRPLLTYKTRKLRR